MSSGIKVIFVVFGGFEFAEGRDHTASAPIPDAGSFPTPHGAIPGNIRAGHGEIAEKNGIRLFFVRDRVY